MRKLLVLLAAILCSLPVWATTRYIAQTAGTFSGGTACNGQTAITVATWNSVNATGDTGYLCGALTASAGASGYITVNGTGETLIFDTGASLSAPYWGGNGAINSTQANTTINGGTNGVIAATANGTGLANSVSATTGVMMSGANPLVENLTISNLYVHTVDLADTADGTQNSRGAIYFSNASGAVASGNTIHDTGTCIRLGYTSVTNFSAYNNTCYNMNWGIIVGDNGAGDTLSGTCNIYNNIEHDTYLWDQSNDSNHHDFIYIFATNGGSSLPACNIYNNYLYGDFGNYTNTLIFTSNNTSPSNTCGGDYIFNNLIVNTGASGHTPANGIVQGWCTGDYFLNNTIVGNGQTSQNSLGNTSSLIRPNPGSFALIENNVLYDGYVGQYLSGAVTTMDYNDYNTLSYVGWDSANNSYSTLAAWQGCNAHDCPATHDLNSITASPGFTNSTNCTTAASSTACVPASGSSLIGAAVSLYSTCNGQANPGLGALCSDAAGNARPNAAWDMGAYQYQAAIIGAFSASGNVTMSGTVTLP